MGKPRQVPVLVVALAIGGCTGAVLGFHDSQEGGGWLPEADDRLTGGDPDDRALLDADGRLIGGDPDDRAPGDAAAATWARTYSASPLTTHAGGVALFSGGIVAVGNRLAVERYEDQWVNPRYDILVLGIDDAGELLWSKTLGGEGWSATINVIPAEDGGFLIVGTKSSEGAGCPWLVRLDGAGTVVWEVNEYVYEVRRAPDGGYVIAGESVSFATAEYSDLWILKLDNAGRLQNSDCADISSDWNDIHAETFDVEPTDLAVTATLRQSTPEATGFGTVAAEVTVGAQCAPK